jgi:metal-responsive CopG/Arc/MetJ family transcriptional regulator
MRRKRAKKIIQVPIEENFLKRIDESAGDVAESRSAFIREACKLRLRDLEAKELERRYVAGYRKRPEETAWAKTGAKFLSRVLSKEKW